MYGRYLCFVSICCLVQLMFVCLLFLMRGCDVVACEKREVRIRYEGG